MARVKLMDGVTVSENLLKANWPTENRRTLDESVVAAAEQARRMFGIQPFQNVSQYFDAVDAVRKGESPLAVVVLNSEMAGGNGHSDEHFTTQMGEDYSRRVMDRGHARYPEGFGGWRRNERSALLDRRKRRASFTDIEIPGQNRMMVRVDYPSSGRPEPRSNRLNYLLDSQEISEMSTHVETAQRAAQILRPYANQRVMDRITLEFIGLAEIDRALPALVAEAFIQRFGQLSRSVLGNYPVIEAAHLDQELTKKGLSFTSLLGAGRLTYDAQTNEVVVLNNAVVNTLTQEGLKPNEYLASEFAMQYNFTRNALGLIEVSLPQSKVPISELRNVLFAGYRDDPFEGVVSRLGKPARPIDHLRGYTPDRKYVPQQTIKH